VTHLSGGPSPSYTTRWDVPPRCDECAFDWESPLEDFVAELASFGNSYAACLTVLPGEDDARDRGWVWPCVGDDGTVGE